MVERSRWEGTMAHSPAHDARFRRIYDQHFAAVQRYCLRRLPLADANDAVSEVFLVAWKKRSQIPDEPLPWLYAVAKNVVRNFSRASRRSKRVATRVQSEPIYPTPGADVQVVRKAEDDALMKALRTLSDADQEVLMLRAWEGLSASEVAHVVDCSLAAAEKRLARAMRRLGTALKATHPHAIGEEAR
jgi:RNA polymerase sigma factor (sigma-70 family)